MKVRLLAIDLDGTLLTKDKKVLDSSRVALRAAAEAGIQVVLASGRIVTSMRPFAESIGLDQAPMISGNGTYWTLGKTHEPVQLPLPKEALVTVADYCRHHSIHLNIYTATRLFFLQETEWGEVYKSRVESIKTELADAAYGDLPSLKVLLVDHPDRIPMHDAALGEMLSHLPIRSTESEPEYLEFMDYRANKGNALAQIAGALGMQREEVAAIGDYLNDLEMLDYAGLSAAVANAHPKTKSTAKVVVSSHEEDGVSEFVEQYVLKQR